MNAKNVNLAHKLAECVHMCNDCFNSCLEEQDIHMMKECIRLDKECAEICVTTLALLYAGSHFQEKMLMLCEHACTMCAEECRKFPHDHCRECAESCEECAKACREYLEQIDK